MTHSTAVIMAQMLVDVGIFTAHDAGGEWPLYVGSLPDTPPNAASMRDTTSIQKKRIIGTGLTIWGHGFQLRVRTSRYSSGWAKAEEAIQFLMALHMGTVSIDSNEYSVDSVELPSHIIAMGQDEQRRESFSVNGLVMFL